MILSDQRVHTVHCIFDYDLFIFAKETHNEQTMATCLHLFYLTKRETLDNDDNLF